MAMIAQEVLAKHMHAVTTSDDMKVQGGPETMLLAISKKKVYILLFTYTFSKNLYKFWTKNHKINGMRRT